MPPNFSDTLIVQGLNLPTAMEISPDGHMILVSQKCGDLKVISNGVLLAQPFVSISVDCNGYDIGLLGIAFDPNHDTNGYVYVFYTPQENPLHYRVSRFTTDPANHHLALVGSEFILLDTEPMASTSHPGGALEFGPDGTLFVSLGEGYSASQSQDMSTWFGKMLRINSDGTVPSDNPFVGVSGTLPEIWASGLRNPFTFQISSTGIMYIADVGQISWEEINEGVAGANYGWPTCEGACSSPPLVDPVYAYAHPCGTSCSGTEGGASIIGGPFYESTQFPATYQGSYFFADYAQDWIKRLTPTNQVVDFASDISAPVAIELAPDGSLYYLSIFPGEVHQITYDLANSIPTAVATANPSSGLSPLFVTFDGSGSSDLDGDPLTYSWDFGDGSPAESGVSVTHTFGSVGTYTAVLTVDDGNGADIDSVIINVGNPPVGTIDTPPIGTLYNGGDTILFSGSASDTEDGTLPASAYEWTIDFHHNTHTHPYLLFSGITSGSYDIDSVNETDPDVWYRVYLTVTDSDGLSHTTFQDVLPNTVNLTIDTNVAGLQILLDSQPKTTPYSFVGVVGISRTLEAFTSQILNGDTYDYDSWSDGGAIAHTILTPATDTTYTASHILGTPATAGPTTPVLESAYLDNSLPPGPGYVLSWSLPLSTLGTPDGGYDTVIDGVDDNAHRTTELQIEITDIDTSVATCFSVQARWTQTGVYPIGNEICLPPLGSSAPPVVSANPTGGAFLNSVDVLLSATDDFDPSPTIHYTIDGTPATTASPVYVSLITITADTTLSFMATDAEGKVSPVSTEVFVVAATDVTPPVVSANPTSGTFFNAGEILLTATDDFDPLPIIHYTTDGSSATTASPVYTGPFFITTDTTVSFLATDASGNVSPASTEVYVVSPDVTPPVVSASPTGGTFAGSVVVTISATDDANQPPTIHYTTDGTTPTTSSPVYVSLITITADTTVSFLATDASGNVSPASTEVYVITVLATPGPTTPVLESAYLDNSLPPGPGYVLSWSLPLSTLGTPDGGYDTVIDGVDDNVHRTTELQIEITDIGTSAAHCFSMQARWTQTGVYPIGNEICLPPLGSSAPPVVSANPTGGTFAGSVVVTISATDDFDPSPTIHYTTDGTTPTTSSPVYVSLITITATTTVSFLATDAEGKVSPVSTEAYVIITPDVTIPSGTFIPGCEATNSCYVPYQIQVNSGKTVLWYNDDSAPHTVTSGTPLGGPNGLFDSGVFAGGQTFSNTFNQAGTYPYYCTLHPWMIGEVIVDSGTAPVVSANPTSGTYVNSVDVTISATDDTDPSPTIHYTTDGSSATTASPVYVSLITITTDTTLNFMAVDATGNTSAVSTEVYVITVADVTAPVLSASPTGGTYVSSVDVTISATDDVDPSPTIHYTMDGTTPTTASPVYTGPITITTDTTLSCIAVDSSGNTSLVDTAVYVITPDVTAPVVSANPTGGTYVNSVDVTISATDDFDPSPTIHYTTDGTPATTASPVYVSLITITADTTLNFMAVDAVGNTSAVSTEVYVITIDVTAPVVSASPTGGSFFNSVDVTISATDDVDPSPTIHYTTDGTTPTTASPVYVSLITITADTTLNFMAVDAVGNTSAVSTEVYVITIDVTAPVVSASPTGGTFAGSVVVSISAIDIVDPTSTIYYTTDGTTPTTGSPVYSSSIFIPADTTLNFIAVDAAGNASAVSTEVYVITTPPSAPTGLTATAVSTSQINLSWSAPSDDGGSPLTGYQIEVMVGTGPWSILVANTGISTSFSDTGLSPSTTYTYRISAINSNGASVYGVYAGLYTDPGDGSSLSPAWQRVYDAKVAHPDVRIIITANPGNGPGTAIRSDHQYSIPALRSVGINVIGYVSTDWNDGPKTDASIKAEIDTWVSWYGDGALGPGLGITGIMLDEMANDIDANGFNGDNVGWYTSLTDYIKNTKGLSFVQGNPGIDTEEAYIGSVDQMKVHEGSVLPILANLFNDWKLNYPISNFAIIPHTISTDPQTIEDYVLESQQYMSDIYIQDDGVDGNPWDSLSSYFEKIVETQALGNLGGTSVASTEASATTQTPPPSTIPDAPTGLTATEVSTSQINLSWSAPSDDGGSPLTGYQIEVMVGTGPWSILVANTGISTSFSDTGLSPSTTYTYRVSAINSIGTSVASTEASATTPTTPVGTNISTCQTLNIPGETYVLTSDITTSGDCFLITADGITLHGDGHKISGDATEIGVDLVSVTGVTVQNLDVSFFNWGIYLHSSNGNTITNNIITNIATYGLDLSGSSNNLISSNYFSLNDNGIHMEPASSNGNTITLNTLYQNGHEQMHLHTTNDNNLVYHNNFLEPTAVQINDECVGCNNQFFIGAGGNYYSDYDEPSEGCDDVNVDGYCDDPFMIQSTGPFIPNNNQDDLPFTVQNGWGPSVDTTPPVVTVPSDMSVGATDASGAVVTFTASATDDVDGPLTPTCTPPSGSTFPLGTTTVTCGATDTAGNTGSASFDITVAVDTTPPVVTVPSDMTVGATDASGAVVTFTASATDDVDGPLTPTCTPPSGSTFPLGTTTVTCGATDTAGNTGSASFDITVVTAVTGPTTPVLESAYLDNSLLPGPGYVLSWSLPPTSLGTPDGGYDTVIDGVDDNAHRTTELQIEITDIDTSVAHCFSMQARWTQTGAYPIGNEICVPPLGTDTPPVVSVSPTGGTYVISVDVTISAIDDIDPSPTIHYTIDGTPVTTTSPVYTVPIPITTTTTLSFLATDSSGNTSLVGTQVYVIIAADVTAPVVSANPTGGTFAGSVVVTISATDDIDPSPTIHYTTDGTPATTASPVYVSLITITADTTLSFLATDSSGNTSLVGIQVYVITILTETGPTTPVLESATLVNSPPPGPGYVLSWSLPPTSLGTPDGGYDIVLDGVDTQDTYRTTATSLTINGLDTSVAHCFIAQARWTQTSPSVFPEGNEICVPPLGTDTPPVVSVSPTGGTYVISVDVTISAIDDIDPSPTIHYTTDGTPVTTTSPVYTVPIPITTTTTLSFLATDSSGNTSLVGTQVYVIIAADVTAPVVSASPTGGTFAGSVVVAISATDDIDPSPTIHYTTDGTPATTASPVYVSLITITADTTLSFLATDSSGNTSLVGIQVYVITILTETGPTNAVLDSVLGQYDLSWTTPTTTLGVPSGGYDIWIDGIDTNGIWRTAATSVTITGLDTTVAHCFEIQSRWNQLSPPVQPISNEICIPPV